jgi:hypothetical protein
MDEREIVELARQGRRDAFETLVRMYGQKVFHLAYGFVHDAPRPTTWPGDLRQAYLALKGFDAGPVRDLAVPDRRQPHQTISDGAGRDLAGGAPRLPAAETGPGSAEGASSRRRLVEAWDVAAEY